jgi:hypothetical protein
MEVLDINIFLSFKKQDIVQELEPETINLIKKLFGTINRNIKGKKNMNKQNNILKNKQIQTKKDTIINRVNLILNKLSESNINNIILEFIENINQVDKEQFDEIQKTIYLKVLSEIIFANIYLQFIRILGYVYKQVQGYDFSYFISIVESKFRHDYTNWDIEAESKFDFIKDLNGETNRINNLMLINILVENKLLSDKIIVECDEVILEQTLFLPDIYYWFNAKNRVLTEQEKNQVNIYIKNNGTTQRETVLLESLVNKSVKLNDKLIILTHSEPVNIIKTDTLQLECDNIIEEYFLIKSLDDVNYFITNRCNDAISKNKFCKIIFDAYFSLNKEKSAEIFDLIKALIKYESLFKSNIIKGLLLIHNNWKELSIDYYNPHDKMKVLLTMFKSVDITKGIEVIMTQYKI